MKKKLLLSFSLALMCGASLCAGNITVRAVKLPAEKVFADIMKQSGKNFVYSAGLLDNMIVSVNLKDSPLNEALDQIFKNTDISYKIKGTMFHYSVIKRSLNRR